MKAVIEGILFLVGDEGVTLDDLVKILNIGKNDIISYLRECDVKSKGQGSRQDPYDLFKELVYKILHS